MPYRITLFYCINSFRVTAADALSCEGRAAVRLVKMACSSMVKDIYLLRAFEAQADAVGVLICARGRCRYIEGNVRARKRVQWVQQLLAEIGIGGERLVLYHADDGQASTLRTVLEELVSTVDRLGICPAGSPLEG